ncbi:tetratricopeptide repeat protein [Coleofasciculus sp. FACHB-712]|uniref:tetratricopeptide repeat protein n=1 Tax=Cyanophyceae TaxID=3028117 RepID=UPI001685368A|nr:MULTISPECIES: tetratricopeptide repeat protein [unclassified Coleofasciculus]MBD1943848.1 tetratricopeptide repeat protein [Coleofasciculus sp. FACHB-712]MBD2538400.1 tetratricopeptide repeat protein [Coleofasciculus sp. FACHB-SPT36]
MRSISNPPEDKFLEAPNYWNLEKLYIDLARVNGGKPITPKQKYLLKGILLYNSPSEIAKICGYGGKNPAESVKQTLQPVYQLIKTLYNIPSETRIVYNKLPFLLNEYSLRNKNQLQNHFQVTHISECSQETEQNEQLATTSSDNPTWQTIEDVTLYIEKFFQHCEQEEYIKALYTIFDGDNYDNCVYKFLWLHGYNALIVSLYERLLQSWQPRKSEKWEFEIALTCLGGAYHRLGEYQRAIDYYEHSLEIALEIDDINGVAGSLVNLGLVYDSLEQYQEAIEYSYRGLYMARKIGNREFAANALHNLGSIHNSLEHYHLAIDYYYHSLEIKQNLGNEQEDASSLINIGNAYRNLGEYQQALEFLPQGIKIARQNGHHEFEANGWFNLGLTLENLDQESEAILAYKNAYALFKERGFDAEAEDCKNAIQALSESIHDDED